MKIQAKLTGCSNLLHGWGQDGQVMAHGCLSGARGDAGMQGTDGERVWGPWVSRGLNSEGSRLSLQPTMHGATC